MIRAFPDLYPDELLYSGYARYAYRMNYPGLKKVTDELFGSQNIIASIPFTSHLNYFIAHQPYQDRFVANLLIMEHTLLPFYAPFLPQARVQQLELDMCGTNGPSIYMRAGLMASTIPMPQYLQYCPDCTREDQKHLGEKYWHRHHQVPGVSICHVHNVWLEQSEVQIHNRQTRHRFVAAEEALKYPVNSRSIDASSPLCSTLLFIAREAAWLLQQRNLSPGLEFLHIAYKHALASRDLTTYSGRIRMSDLQEMFASYYPGSVLSYLHCDLNRKSPDNWLARLVRKPNGSQHPLQHILLLCFLGYTIQTFFSNPSDNDPFGTGPWPCLNIASDHYHQRQIEQCDIVYGKYTGRRPVGTFSCSCGFVYSRMGPDSSVEDQFRFSKVKTFGQSWEMRLQTLWEEESVSLRSIARHLGVDPLTVKRHANRIGLPFPRLKGKISQLRDDQMLRMHTPSMLEALTLEAYRTQWLSLLQMRPNAGVKKIRSEIPRVYTWLYRNDKKWLKEHMPVDVEKTRAKSHRVDWEERDLQLAEEVKDAAIHLKNLPGYPVRLTVSTIGRQIDKLALLQQHLSKLPRTASCMNELIETREAFAVRKIRWVGETYHRESSYPQRWQLIKKAGVERLATNSRVKEEIDTVLHALWLSIPINAHYTNNI